MTSVCGHVMNLDFIGKYNNWDRVDPVSCLHLTELYHWHKWLNINLTFMDPCIIVQFTKKNPTRCNNVSKCYYSIFI